MTFRLRFILIFSATIAFILVTNSATTKTQTITNFGYCRSEPGSSIVYFSNVMDFGTNGMIDANLGLFAKMIRYSRPSLVVRIFRQL